MTTGKGTSFLQRTRDSKKVMVLDLGLLGDSVHLIPALWTVRQAYPKAELHVMVAEHISSLFGCTPWIDRVWGYPRFLKRATLGQNISIVRAMHREKFDALINLNGSDRSSWLSYFSGIPYRLGRMPCNGGPFFWKQMFTDHVKYPRLTEPVYTQRCRCLEQAGFPYEPEFHVQVTHEHLRSAGIPADDAGTYFHISPFTTADQKEMPPEKLVELIQLLENGFPQKRLMLTCSPTERERTKMKSLLAMLPRRPWKIFDGGLDLTQLSAVIRYSTVHLSGDSGPVHLAMMTGTPTVSWFWPNPGIKEWLPTGELHRTIIGHSSPGQFIKDINVADLVRLVDEIVKARESAGIAVPK